MILIRSKQQNTQSVVSAERISAASELLNRNAQHSVSSSRLAKLRASHLDNCTARKIQKKASCKRPGMVVVKKQIGLRIEDEKIKLQRAQGGCPGTIRRRRTWQAAKSYGEPQAGTDP